jgi:hypothetical protein
LLRCEAHLPVRRETSEPGTPPQSRCGSAGSIPGFPETCLPSGRPEPGSAPPSSVTQEVL